LEESIELVYSYNKFHRLNNHNSHSNRSLNKDYRLSHYKKIHPHQGFSNLLVRKEFNFPELGNVLSFGREVESKVSLLKKRIKEFNRDKVNLNYPNRFLAIKILENDEEIKKKFEQVQKSEQIINLAKEFRVELENFHGEDISTIISSEIYNNINQILNIVRYPQSQQRVKKETLLDKLDHLTTHSIWGYVILISVLFGIYFFTFIIGDFLGQLIDNIYSLLTNNIYNLFGSDNLWVGLFWDGAVGGFFGAFGGVLVYVIPFFLIIELLQDSGYLPRAAFLMDRIMHAVGVHGKTIIPMILGFGCNVPACAGCRIMETKREKKISIALSSLIPCAATMTVVLGLVGRYLGFFWVLILFAINLSVIVIVGRLLNKSMPGKCTELIMEMHEYRKPNFEVVFKQTWIRSKEFIFKSMPLIVIIGMILEIMLVLRILDPINLILQPITVFWLGLPMITGIFLIYGILRKELTLILLEVLAGSLGLTLLQLMTPMQMIIFSLVTMLYIPCFTTIIIIARETSWKYAIKLSLLEIGMALLIGGIINWGSYLIFLWL
jgi:ferrous iron transport protein B